jgi:hypothetical protein
VEDALNSVPWRSEISPETGLERVFPGIFPPNSETPSRRQKPRSVAKLAASIRARRSAPSRNIASASIADAA